MKQERVILSFIMVLIGLLVAGLAFYFYQSTKVVSDNSTASTILTPTPTPRPTIFLSLSQPVNESVVTSKTLNVSGKTNPEATVVVVTDSDQQVFKPSSQGNFSTSVTLTDDQNLITIWAISPNGESTSVQKTVTYSTDNF
ncbi:MAG TPA: hypothetical protein VES68_01980 [Candidatus Sulfotelmatobacter sp.]|nr:hypothetical protein [Candidatus Sulfotelmatobacter sp.]